MSVELPRQPHDGRPRHCYKCKTSFVPVPEYRNARMCQPCRESPAAGRHRVKSAPKPRHEGHTHAWDSRSLAIVEAAFLRMAWGRVQRTFVTGNSE